MKNFVLLLPAFLFVQATSAIGIMPPPVVPTEKDSIAHSYVIDEVIIESFKQNLNLSTKPISASLLTALDIQKRNIVSVKELSGLVPNLFIPDYGTKLSTPVYIRGIGSRTNAPSVGLYVDGMPYFDRSSFDFNLNDVERIEVLRGSQGTIYGRNAMGGIINVYTKSPFTYQGGYASLMAGNYDSYKGELSYYGKLGESFGYGVSGNYIRNGGFFKNQFTGSMADKMDATSQRLRLSWKFAAQWTAHLTSTYEYMDQNGFPYAPYVDSTKTVQDVNYNRDSYYHRNMINNGLTFVYLGSSIKFVSQSSFQYFDGKQGVDQDFTTTDTYYVLFNQRQQMYSQEFNLQSAKPGSYDWLFGAFAFDQHYRQANDVNYITRSTHSTNKVTNPATGFALYHQSTYKNLFFEGLSVVAGLRYDWEKIKIESITGDGKTENAPVTGKDHYAQLTPKFSLEYAFPQGGITYATVTKGYKAGGFNTAVDTISERSFKPEHSWTYEIGAKKSFCNNFLYTEACVFYIDWRDQQVTQVRLSGQGNKTLNAGKSKSKGVEASAQINPTKNLCFFLNYGYTYAKFNEYVYDVKKSINYSGNMLPLVPRHTFSAGLDYGVEVRDGLLEKINFHGEYIGLGKMYWNESNAAVQPFYGVVNANIGFERQNFSLDLWIRNLTNEKYVAYQFTSSSKLFAQAGKPYTFGAKLSVKF
ncbi:MAG: TonB-dependent receptor plug [Bacteroidetes bacterium]|nr:TonB-dependent receptor plug [Bacteroidota bacterium]